VYLRKEELAALRKVATRCGRSVADLVSEAVRKVVLKPQATRPIPIWDGEPERASIDVRSRAHPARQKDRGRLIGARQAHDRAAQELGPAAEETVEYARRINTMTDNTESIILEHLKAIRNDLGTLKEDSTFMKARLSSIEHQLAGVHTDLAAINARLDSHDKRFERVERRLELTSA